MKPRCDHCKFWQKPRRGDHENNGYCHRSAPLPPPGDFHYTALWFLFQACSVDDKAEGFPNWEETDDFPSGWPTTHNDDWCGEFKPKRKPTPRK